MDKAEGELRSKVSKSTRGASNRNSIPKARRRQSQRIILDEWQREAVEHRGDLLLCTGRRIGKTYVMAYKAIRRMATEPGTKIIVVSLTEDQAELIIEFARQIALLEYQRLISKKKTENTKRKITFKNSSQIMSRPVGLTGDAVRGFDGDILIVDEASRMPDIMWMAAKPILLMTGGEIWMCSTPHGKQGYFWEQFNKAHNKKDPQARFKVIYKTSEDVVYNRPISASWTEEQRKASIRVLEEEKKDMSQLEYGQEYLGMFMEDLMQMFSDEIIEKCSNLSRSSIEVGPPSQSFAAGRDFFMGCDIARLGGDELTFEIIERTKDDRLLHRESIDEKYKLTTYTFDKIKELDKIWNFRRQGIGIDAGSGSLGVTILDFLLKDSQVRSKVVAINNLSRNLDKRGEKKKQIMKVDLYQHLLALMEQGRIKLLKDEKVRLSLKSVQYEHVRKEGVQTQTRIFGKDTHIAEGLVRAAWLANQKHLNLQISWI